MYGVSHIVDALLGAPFGASTIGDSHIRVLRIAGGFWQ